MKRIAFILSVASMVAGLAGCTEKESEKTPSTPTVTISIDNEKTTSASIEFTITPTNAEKCSYVVIESTETVPSESDILANGNATDPDKASAISVDGLKSATKYLVMAAVSSTDGQTGIAQQEVTTAEAPVVVLDRGTAKVYGTRNIGLTLRGEDSGIDYEISLDLYDDAYAETGYLTEGTYTVSEGTEDRAMNSEYSYLQKDNDQYKFVSGTLEVKIVDNAYSLKLNVELNNEGGNFVGTFDGTIDDMPIK